MYVVGGTDFVRCPGMSIVRLQPEVEFPRSNGTGERCGVLVGVQRPDDVGWTIQGAVEVPNVRAEGFAIDGQVMAEMMDRYGVRLIGHWHTHPDWDDEVPSAEDLEECGPWLGCVWHPLLQRLGWYVRGEYLYSMGLETARGPAPSS